MFELLNEQPKDKILALMQAYREDPREAKIDLGVGVYKTAEGKTPIMRAIKAAEKQLWEVEETKSYTGLAGDIGFADAMIDLLIGDACPRDCIAAAATPGGTGAVRQGFDMIRMANREARVFVSDPTWPNHLSMLKHMDLHIQPYRYFDSDSRSVDFAGMMEDISDARVGDVVLLHGCCHNPTGANLTLEQWQQVIDQLLKSGATPMIDIAYQGFGDGLAEDAAGLRMVVSQMPEVLIAASCSKNFGVYRERTGLLMAVAQDKVRRETNQGMLNHLNRQNFSFPPDHGARLVTMVLQDPALRADWEEELREVREGVLSLRQQLSAELARLTNSDRFAFIAEHRGMFSRLGATPEQVEAMRESHGVYMVGDSRINMAGLNKDSIPVLARAMVEAGV
ncbi:aromatic amino acid transaminase [Sagittula sp. SSi028]|uniref:amino acid aminotransferase n=1 Tax=Sagittula sp. SSi028 TaxID=3400636 RepID=UPI003AF5E50F